MSKARDIGLTVGAGGVVNWQVDDLEVQSCGSEEQIEIAEGIGTPQLFAVCFDTIVI